MKKTKYVVSYIFDENNTKVLLIKKKRPTFLVGKMTGIGGHVENFDETHYHAIQREINEESNLNIPIDKIHLIDSICAEEYTLDVFAIIAEEKEISNFKNNIDEEQNWFNIEDIKSEKLDIQYAYGTYEAIIYIHENFDKFK